MALGKTDHRRKQNENKNQTLTESKLKPSSNRRGSEEEQPPFNYTTPDIPFHYLNGRFAVEIVSSVSCSAFGRLACIHSPTFRTREREIIILKKIIMSARRSLIIVLIGRAIMCSLVTMTTTTSNSTAMAFQERYGSHRTTRRSPSDAFVTTMTGWYSTKPSITTSFAWGQLVATDRGSIQRRRQGILRLAETRANQEPEHSSTTASTSHDTNESEGIVINDILSLANGDDVTETTSSADTRTSEVLVPSIVSDINSQRENLKHSLDSLLPTRGEDGIYHCRDRQDFTELCQACADQIIVLKCYAPWCRACKAMEPKFIQLCHDSRFETLPIVWADITSLHNADLMQEWDMVALPAFRLYARGQLQDSFECGPSKFPLLKKKLTTLINQCVDATTRQLKEEIVTSPYTVPEERDVGVPVNSVAATTQSIPPAKAAVSPITSTTPIHRIPTTVATSYSSSEAHRNFTLNVHRALEPRRRKKPSVEDLDKYIEFIKLRNAQISSKNTSSSSAHHQRQRNST